MSGTSPDRPGFTLYNPAVLGKDDLCAQFVLRTELYESLLASVRDADGEHAPQHHLVTGPRGMGKTTLLHRLRFGIDDDPEVGRRVIPLTFPEEQYDIRDLATLWRNALDALADALDARGDAAGARSLDAESETTAQGPRAGRTDALLALLTGWADRRGAVLVLLLDNLDRVLARLGEQEQWGLRKTLAAHPRLVVIAASTVPPASTYAYSKAFYDFFRHHPLEPLSLVESKAYLLRLAELRNAPGVRRAIEDHPERLAAVRDMTGGSPRALAILFLVLSEEDELAAASALERVLDVVTPYYKHVIEALADRQQIVVDALAKHWHPATAHALAEATGLAVQEVNSNLSRLEKAGMVEKVDPPGGGRYRYLLSERLLNIWYLMRSGRRMRERLLWLVRFLEAMYGPSPVDDGRALVADAGAPGDLSAPLANALLRRPGGPIPQSGLVAEAPAAPALPREAARDGPPAARRSLAPEFRRAEALAAAALDDEADTPAGRQKPGVGVPRPRLTPPTTSSPSPGTPPPAPGRST